MQVSSFRYFILFVWIITEKKLLVLDLDSIDLKILSILLKGATIPYTGIAKMVFVSSVTVHVRMKKMAEMGVAKGYTLLIDYSKLGYDINAFLGIYLQKVNCMSRRLNVLKRFRRF